MSVFVPTGATVAVDPLDMLLVAPNGSTSTTLYLAQGQPVVVAALPAAVVAELNTAAGLVGPDTLFTTPVAASEWPSPVYIAGAQVKRVQSSGATNLGSMVLFALSGFMVTVPAVNLAAMLVLINATTTGGGGGGGVFVQSGASENAPLAWVPTVTGAADNVASLSSCKFMRIGSEANAAQGDLVLVTIMVNLTVTGATAPGFTFTVPPNAPCTNDMNVLSGAQDNTIAAYPVYFFAAPGGTDDEIQIFCDVALPGPGPVGLTVTLAIMYVVAGS